MTYRMAGYSTVGQKIESFSFVKAVVQDAQRSLASRYGTIQGAQCWP